MLEKYWNSFKTFITEEEVCVFISNHLLYLFLVGAAIALVLFILLMIKWKKEQKKERQEERKRGRSLLKFISNKRNKTY